MNLFEMFLMQKQGGKQQIPLSDVIPQFIADHAKHFQRMWPRVLEGTILPVIPNTLRRYPHMFDGNATENIFFVASLAVELNGVRILYGEAAVQQVESGVREYFVDQGFKADTISQIFSKVHNSWDEADRGNHNPIEVLGSTMFDLVGCVDSVEDDGGHMVSPVAMLGLGSAVMMLCSGWWKRNAPYHNSIA